MKNRIVVGLLLLGALLLLAACGSQTNPSQGTTRPAPTTVSGVKEVHVVIKDGTITSSMKNFSAGIPYTFVVVNQGKTSHNFIILKRISGAAATTPNQIMGYCILFLQHRWLLARHRLFRTSSHSRQNREAFNSQLIWLDLMDQKGHIFL